MIKKSVYEVDPKPMDMEGAKDIKLRLMISEDDGAPTFNLRVFDLAPGGHSPLHEHDYEHEIFILEGEGEVFSEGAYQPVKPYDVLLVVPGEKHHLRNNTDKLLRFICMVPQEGKSGRSTNAFCGK